ncbi:MAG: hypothetical protein LWW98_11910 [Deltaproteobacteria bacterium]|nr:hypothetical protein [Deltaproteobacteria bacterium]
MEMQTAFQSSVYEQTVINIIRKLPSERILQLIDFARFLEFQIVQKSSDDWLDKQETETKEGIRASEEKWDKLFVKPEAKHVMREMAHEALEDYRAGRTTDIAITKDGRLAPA